MTALTDLVSDDFRSLLHDLATILILVQRRKHSSEFDEVDCSMISSCLRREVKLSKFLQLFCESLKLVQIL